MMRQKSVMHVASPRRGLWSIDLFHTTLYLSRETPRSNGISIRFNACEEISVQLLQPFAHYFTITNRSSARWHPFVSCRRCHRDHSEERVSRASSNLIMQLRVHYICQQMRRAHRSHNTCCERPHSMGRPLAVRRAFSLSTIGA